MSLFYRTPKQSVGRANQDYWLDLRRFNPKWYRRARCASQLLTREWVCDIGCGRQDLSRYLDPQAVYLPADLAAWESGVAICDLNKREYPEDYLAAADCAVFLGVFERIDDVPTVLSDLADRVEHLCMSYHDANRLKNWPHQWGMALGREELVRMVENAGFTVGKTLYFNNTQIILRANSNRFQAFEEREHARSRVALKPLSAKVRIARAINAVLR